MDLDELVRAACSGDLDARDDIGPWLADTVRRFFAKANKGREYIHELSQDTMVDVWAKIPEQHPATADEFVRMVMRMAWTSRLRERSRGAREHENEEKLQLVPEPDPTRSPASKLVQREIAERYLRELSTPIREAVLWRIEGGTLKAYADERGISLNTAHSRYRIGMDQLRERLARDSLTPSQCGL